MILTQEQIDRLRQLLDDASQALAAQTVGVDLTDEQIQALIDDGWLDPEWADHELVRMAYGEGAQKATGEAGDGEPPLGPAEVRAREIARQGAGQYCVGLGQKAAGAMIGEITAASQVLAVNTRELIADETATAIAQRETTKALAGSLRRITKDWSRDWERIANTEMQTAYEQGMFEATVAAHGTEAMMAKVPDPGACDMCRSLYLGPDDHPIVRPASWWEAQGVVNVGRKQADWKPTIGAAHPHCRCTLIRVPAGMVVTEDGELEFPEETEKATTEDLEKAGESIGTVHVWRDGRRYRKTAPGRWDLITEESKEKQLDIFSVIKAADNRVTEKDQEPLTRTSPPIKVPEQIMDALQRGGILVVNTSGGKDSQAMSYALADCPELAPFRDQIVFLHAHLGRAEWPGSTQHARDIAKELGIPLHEVTRDKAKNRVTGKVEPWEGDFLTHFEERAAWPSMAHRVCTSDLKVGPLWKWMRRELGGLGVPIISAVGIRKQEGEHDKTSGNSRWFAEELGRAGKKDVGSVKGEPREGWNWSPLLDWDVEDVWAAIRESGVDRHYAYDLGASRLSCLFCPLASEGDLMVAAQNNPELLDEWVKSEKKMRATHEERRQLFAEAISQGIAEGWAETVGDVWVLRGKGSDEKILLAGGKRRGKDVEIPKRYLKPFLEFKKGKKGDPQSKTLESLREKLRAMAKSLGVSEGALVSAVMQHKRLMDAYETLAHAAADDREKGTEASLARRRELLGRMAAIGRELKGSHAFPIRRGSTEDLEKAEQLKLFGGARQAGPFIGPKGGKWANPQRTIPWHPPKTADTEKGQEALKAPVRSMSLVFVNASGGAEKKRFLEGAKHLAEHNAGVQIVAHEIPKRASALKRYADAGAQGLRVMVDSGEFGRFSANLSAQISAEKAAGKPDDAKLQEAAEKAREKAEKVNAGWSFDKVFDRYEALAGVMPPGTLQITAPDKIADPEETARLRQQYAGRVRKLQEMGAEVIAPIQARDPDGMAEDYVRVTEAFGRDVILGFPTAKAPVEMDAILPFIVTLYANGEFPKLHFLGATEPAKLGNRGVQLVAAAYFAKRGVPRERILELVGTPRDAARALRHVKTQRDVLSRESDVLHDQMESWARAETSRTPGLAGGPFDPDSEAFDETEVWSQFFESNPEEFDLQIREGQDKEGLFREMAEHLVQSDSQVLGRVQRYELQHDPVSGKQEKQSEEMESVRKVERFIPLLDRYLQAKEHVGETMVPTHSSGFEALFGKYAKSFVMEDLIKADQLGLFAPRPKKASGGPYIGPRGGKWADPQHTIPWQAAKAPRAKAAEKPESKEPTKAPPVESRSFETGIKTWVTSEGRGTSKEDLEHALAERLAAQKKSVVYSFKVEHAGRQKGRVVNPGSDYPYYEPEHDLWKITIDHREVIPGHTLVGHVETGDDGLITIFDDETKVSKETYKRAQGGDCDVCKSKRPRNKVFVVERQADGQQIVVGGECAKKFKGANLSALAQQLSAVGTEVIDEMREDEGFGGGGGGGRTTAEPHEILGVALWLTRKDGYRKKDGPGRGTADAAEGIVGRYKGVKTSTEEWAEIKKVQEEVKRDLPQIRAWVKDQLGDGTDLTRDQAFMLSVSQLLDRDFIGARDFSRVAWVPYRYYRVQAALKLKEKQKAYDPPGAKMHDLPGKWTVVSKNLKESNYGNYWSIIAQAEDGARIWFRGTKGSDEIQEGDSLKLRGKLKEKKDTITFMSHMKAVNESENARQAAEEAEAEKRQAVRDKLKASTKPEDIVQVTLGEFYDPSKEDQGSADQEKFRTKQANAVTVLMDKGVDIPPEALRTAQEYYDGYKPREKNPEMGQAIRQYAQIQAGEHPMQANELVRLFPKIAEKLIREKLPERSAEHIIERSDPTKASFFGPPVKKSTADDLEKAEKAHKLQGSITWRGLKIAIETSAGQKRRWYDPHGKRKGVTEMIDHYGYIRGTIGADGEEIDVYIGPNAWAEKVYVIDQKKAPDFREYDEQKVMIGYRTRAEAITVYLTHYDDPRFLGSVTEVDSKEFAEAAAAGKLNTRRHLRKAYGGPTDWYPAADRRVESGAGLVHRREKKKGKRINRDARVLIDVSRVMEMIEEAIRDRQYRRRPKFDLKNFDFSDDLFTRRKPPDPRQALEAIIGEDRHLNNRENVDAMGERAVAAQQTARDTMRVRDPWVTE